MNIVTFQMIKFNFTSGITTSQWIILFDLFIFCLIFPFIHYSLNFSPYNCFIPFLKFKEEFNFTKISFNEIWRNKNISSFFSYHFWICHKIVSLKLSFQFFEIKSNSNPLYIRIKIKNNLKKEHIVNSFRWFFPTIKKHFWRKNLRNFGDNDLFICWKREFLYGSIWIFLEWNLISIWKINYEFFFIQILIVFLRINIIQPPLKI